MDGAEVVALLVIVLLLPFDAVSVLDVGRADVDVATAVDVTVDVAVVELVVSDLSVLEDVATALAEDDGALDTDWTVDKPLPTSFLASNAFFLVISSTVEDGSVVDELPGVVDEEASSSEPK